MTKRILSLLLALMMLLTCFVACSRDKGNEGETSGVQGGGDQGGDSQGGDSDVYDPSNEQAVDYMVNIEAKDYGGRELTFLCSQNKGDNYVTEEAVDEGNVVAVAVDQRNKAVEAKKGVKIVFNPQVDGWSQGEIFYVTYVRNAVNSGTGSFDILTLEGTYAETIAMEGNLYNLLSVENFNEKAEWWHGSFADNNTLYGNLFMIAGDISHMVLGTAWTVFYNKSVAEKVQLDNFYDIVKEDQWTFESMMTAARAVATVNGDESIYGLGVNRHSMRVIPLSWAIPVCSRTSDGGYELSIMSDRTEAITQTLATALSATDNSMFVDNVSDGQSQQQIIPKFVANKLLFMFLSLDFVKNVKELSGEDTEYGILPYPKYDENQEDYRTSTGNITVYAGIPKNANDPEFSGEMLDALGAGGKSYVYPAYYITTLKGKTAQDPESVEMLDIIRDTMYFDFASVHSGVLDNIGSKFGDPLIPSPGGVPATSFAGTRWESIKLNSGRELTNTLKVYQDMAVTE